MTLNGLDLDLRATLRSLGRDRAFFGVAVAMLALAIGVAAALFGLVRTVLLAPLPFADPDRLVFIAASAPGSEMRGEFGTSREFYLHYREHARLLTGIGTVNSFTNTLRFGERVERLRMSAPTTSLFATLGVTPQLGRLPVEDDGGDVVVISDTLWQTWFGRDPGVIGRVVGFEGGRSRTIVGVMPADFHVPDDGTLLWLSGTITPATVGAPGRFGGTFLIGRLAPGATPAALADELTALARDLPARFGGAPSYARVMEHHRAVVRLLAEQVVGSYRQPLWILAGAAVLILLIACANVANLFQVRLERRQAALATRSALGAEPGRLLRLQAIEAAVVAAAAAIGALLVAAALIRLLPAALPAQLPRVGEFRLDASVVPVVLGLTVLAAIISAAGGLGRATRPSLAALRDGGRGLAGGRHRARQVLVIAQSGLAVVLLFGAGLLLRSMLTLQRVDPGFDPTGIFTFQIAPERPALADAASYARFDLDFLERLRGLPGVSSVGLVENVPIDEGTADMRVRPDRDDAPADGIPLNFTFTAGDYFRTMQIAVVAGRSFEPAEQTSGQGGVVVSRSAANLLWPGADPIGRRLQRQGWNEWETVIGVVEDVHQGGLIGGPEAVLYFPLVGAGGERNPVISSPAYVVKSDRPESIAADIRALVHAVAPEAPMYRQYTMSSLVDRSVAHVRFLMTTMAVAAGLALLLGSIGLYGVLSCAIAERRREIGLRMALGARASQVHRLVVGQALGIVAVGLLVGVLVATSAAGALSGLLFGVEAGDPATLAATVGVMLAVALLASWLPARRATRVDPITALQHI